MLLSFPFSQKTYISPGKIVLVTLFRVEENTIDRFREICQLLENQLTQIYQFHVKLLQFNVDHKLADIKQ